MHNRPLIWLATFLGLLVSSQALGWLLLAQGWPTAGRFMMLLGGAAASAHLFYGLFLWRERPWVRRIGTALAVSFIMVGFAVISFAAGMPRLGITLGGMWVMLAGFVVGLWTLRATLSTGHPITGVARTLVDEAIRMKVALVFLVGVLLLVPILPVMMDHNELLRYRLQAFLTYATAGTSVLLSLMTIFLACGTISSELDQRQIFLTMTKPVGRSQYLLGKWLGISLLNLLLVAVAGGGIYLFVVLLREGPDRGFQDRVAVEEQVLVARQGVRPLPGRDMDMAGMRAERVRQLYAEDPSRFGQMGLNLNDRDTLNRVMNEMDPKLRDQIEKTVIAKWHSIGPQEQRTYRFTGLARAAELADEVQLRFKAYAQPPPEDSKIYLAFWLNGRPWPAESGMHRPVVVTMGDFHVVRLPVTEADANGELELTIRNVHPADPQLSLRTSVTFTPGEGLELLYRVGGFEANLLRTLAIVWVRLVFLAMMGLAAGTFLGFPVASLLGLLVYFTAIASGFLTESLENYSAWVGKDMSMWGTIIWVFAQLFREITNGQFYDALRIVIRILGSIVVALIPSFSRFNPVPLLADGRVVPNELVSQAMLWIGVVWTGVCGLVGWFIFRKRELARVTV